MIAYTLPFGGKHSDKGKKKCYSLFSARRPPSAVFHSGIPSIGRRRIDFTFFKRQSTVKVCNKTKKNIYIYTHTRRSNLFLQLVFSCHCGVEDYTFLRAFSLSILRKKDERSGGCPRLHSVPCSPGTERPAESACQIRSRGERGDLQVGGRSEALIIKMDRGQ